MQAYAPSVAAVALLTNETAVRVCQLALTAVGYSGEVLSDVVEIAELDSLEEFLPFSPCISINRTAGLGCVAKHD
jgi:hypothetical protein